MRHFVERRGDDAILLAEADGDRLELAYSLLFSLPGTPLLVYGDEIGMGDDLSLSGRDPGRTPMQWSDEPNAGFSNADSQSLVRPVVSGGNSVTSLSTSPTSVATPTPSSSGSRGSTVSGPSAPRSATATARSFPRTTPRSSPTG